MKLPSPSPRYEPSRESARNRQLEQADLENHKRGRDLFVSPGRFLITAPNGTVYSIVVDNAGNLSAVAT